MIVFTLAFTKSKYQIQSNIFSEHSATFYGTHDDLGKKPTSSRCCDIRLGTSRRLSTIHALVDSNEQQINREVKESTGNGHLLYADSSQRLRHFAFNFSW